jgi:predicted ATPase with chaperone activity
MRLYCHVESEVSVLTIICPGTAPGAGKSTLARRLTTLLPAMAHGLIGRRTEGP